MISKQINAPAQQDAAPSSTSATEFSTVTIEKNSAAARATVANVAIPEPATGDNEGDPELKFHAAGRDYHHSNVEVALISACVNKTKHLVRLAGELSTEDVYDEHNRALLRAMLEMMYQGTPVNGATLIAHLKATLPDFGDEWIVHVNRCAAATFNPKHIAAYIRKLKEATRIRGGDTYCQHAFSEAFCANLLKLRLPPSKCVGESWYQYVDGVWTLTDKNINRPLAMEVIHPHQREEKRCAAVLSHVESMSQVSSRIFSGAYKLDGPNLLVNVNNGTLVVDPAGAVAMRPHDKDDHFTLKLPTDYDPVAQCELFERTLAQCLPDSDDRQLLKVFGGYMLWPGCEHEASLVAYGEGRTGKSTVAGAIGNVLGKELCGSCGLEDLCASGSYSLPTLKNKMLNLGAELEGTEIATSANFKKLVSGEYLNAREIYGKPESMTTFCKLLFLSNHMPRFRSGSNAEERRLRLLHFNIQVETEDPTLKDRLRGEVSGILNWMLDGLHWLRQNKNIPRGGVKSEALAADFHKNNDPVKAFVEDCCTLGPMGVTPKLDLLYEFQSWCGTRGLPADKMENLFFKGLVQRFELKTIRRKNKEGVREYCFAGVALHHY